MLVCGARSFSHAVGWSVKEPGRTKGRVLVARTCFEPLGAFAPAPFVVIQASQSQHADRRVAIATRLNVDHAKRSPARRAVLQSGREWRRHGSVTMPSKTNADTRCRPVRRARRVSRWMWEVFARTCENRAAASYQI